METPINSQEARKYEPTPEQAARADQLRRFNRLYVYGPIAALSLVVVGLIVWLAIIALVPPSLAARITLSAIADAVLIMGIVPLMLLCAIVPVLFLLATFQARQRGIAPTRQLQRWLWIVDSSVGKLGKRADGAAQSLAKPFIAAQARASFVGALWARLVRLISRSR